MFAEGTDRAAKAKEMREAESDADGTTREIINRVNKTFVTPFDREDIYALAYGLDDAMDEMEEAADLINLYDVVSYPAEFAKLVELIQRCAELTAASMPRLQSLDLDEYWMEIGRLEKAGDKSFRRILSKLFGGKLRSPRGAQAQGRRGQARGRDQRLRDRRQAGGADRGQGVLTGWTWSSRS